MPGRQRFVDEPITPLTESADTGLMAAGGPGLPSRFLWRGAPFEVAAVLRRWRETGPCRHGSGERYVRKHWFEIVTVSGDVMRLYFERQPRGRAPSPRWWLVSVGEAESRPERSDP